jgi:transcriptional regulator with XRE-family HTH domain
MSQRARLKNVKHMAHSPEGDPKALLGELLRLARQQSEYRTQEALSGALGMERTGITRAETGNRVPNVNVLADWLTTCGVSGLARTAIESMWRLARLSDDDEPVKVWFSGYLTAEAAAHSVRIWQPLIVPGLAQTEAYARAIFTAMGMSEEQVSEQLAIRMGRQAILVRPKPPNITIVLDESALHRLIGSPEIMREQLERLLELSRAIVVQIVPSETGGNAGLGGAVTLLEGTGGSVLLAEALIEDQVTTDVDLLIRAGATFDAVRGDALTRAQSRKLIVEAIPNDE